ncbi:MAG: M48 family metalloprotease [Planctomycetes bacterium]|nr:M48 family metalloprotease [Planctomycetota bacterium]
MNPQPHSRPRRSRIPHAILFRVLVFVCAITSVGSADAPPPDEFTQKITAELESKSPEAAVLFRQANEAREREDHVAAAKLYGQVRTLVPTFDHAVRRQAGEILAMGNREMAIQLGRQAVTMDRSAENLTGLAKILSTASGTATPTRQELAESVNVAREAVQLKPKDIYANVALCYAALNYGDIDLARAQITVLMEIAPTSPEPHLLNAFLALDAGRFDDARHALGHAREFGLPAEQYDRMLAALAKAEPVPVGKYVRIASIVLAVWLGLFLFLFAAGVVLSSAALRASRIVPVTPDGKVVGLDAFLRRLYRTVLWLSCGYYFASLPVIALIVVGGAGAIIYASFAIGQIPVKLLVIVAIVAFATISAMVRSLLIRRREGAPGVALDLGSQPKLRAVLDEVAATIGTRPVDSVYLTPGTDVAVMERGGLAKQFVGVRERCLVLGLGALDGMRLRPFKAILGHEYGHFSNRDTAGGGFALAVRRSLLTMAGNLAKGGAASWFNPAWLFLNGFHRVFLRISQGASRLQEVLADRWAAFAYGSAAFESGLCHVIDSSVRFDSHANATLKEVIEAKQPLGNLYSYKPTSPPSEKVLEQAVRAALTAKPSPYDSHPDPMSRICMIRDLAAPGVETAPDDDDCVWSLFDDREALEQRMTAEVRDNLARQHRIRLASA